MDRSQLHLVVIAGGSGTRFWPKSTSRRPKQLLVFERDHSSKGANKSPNKSPKESGSLSLLAQTLARFEGCVPDDQRMIVTTQALKNAIVGEGKGVQVLAEPMGRNTAPCIYWAARTVAEKDPQGVMLVMPSDHYIAKPQAFISVIEAAAQWAVQNDDLVTLGIRPTRPETGYGYLRVSESVTSGRLASESPTELAGFEGVRRVEAFVEKPNHARATEFFSSKNYFWNGGMFLWRAEVILEAFDQFMPEMRDAWEKAGGKIDLAYPQMTATSIDYGVMEKAKNVVTFPLDCGWDDLGSWTSLENLSLSLGAQVGDSVCMGGDLLSVDSSRNIVDVPGRLVALLGVDDLIIVEQGDALLVARKDRAQDIRRVVDEVKKVRPDLV